MSGILTEFTRMETQTRLCVTAAIVAAAFIFISVPAVHAQLFIDLEAGIVSAGSNDVRVPGDGGTLFSLTDDLQAKTSSFLRIRPGIRFGGRHNVSLLYAPLKIVSSGIFREPVRFRDAIIEPDRVVSADYVFNSYRLTYRYDLKTDPKLRIGVGVTAKMRDASITLSNADTSVAETNVGFVPLINIHLNWRINDKLGLLIDGDALVGPQGRAEDIFAGLTYEIAGGLQARAGYRVLEGGADVEKVYNFALIHYGALGAVFWL